jgi:hypothetical protein
VRAKTEEFSPRMNADKRRSEKTEEKSLTTETQRSQRKRKAERKPRPRKAEDSSLKAILF